MSTTLRILIVRGGDNKLKLVAFSEINRRPKTKNCPRRSYKILQNPEFIPPLQLRYGE